MRETIDKQFLELLRPCISRWNNYLHHHEGFKGSVLEFLALEHITVDDKMWVCLRLEVLPLPIIQEFAIRCAESVLHNFEQQYPNDKRPREAIEVARKVIAGELPSSAAMSAAESAKNAALNARSAARSAAFSATNATNAASAAWSAESVASAARSVTWSATNVEDDPRLGVLTKLLNEVCHEK